VHGYADYSLFKIQTMKPVLYNLREGVTLITPTTKSWTYEQIETNDKIEELIIYTDFSDKDQGRSRKRLCSLNGHHPNLKDYKKLILAAPDLLRAIDYYFSVLEEAHGKDWDKNPDHVLQSFLAAYKKALY
jgi:hypothetical protein